MPRTKNNERAEQLRELAALIASKSNAREEISQGFRLIADCMEPCEDCAAKEHADKEFSLGPIPGLWEKYLSAGGSY